jgi:glutaredoxin
MNQPTEHKTSPDSNNSKDKNQKRKMSGRKKKGLFVVILLLAGFIIVNRSEPVETIDCTPEIIASKPDVIMLGAWWCSYCYQAKKYFQRNNIHYCEYDMESSLIGKRLYQEHGGGAVPILLIGDYQLSGFNEQQVEAALSLITKDSANTK